jgi:hypothetical protein
LVREKVLSGLIVQFADYTTKWIASGLLTTRWAMAGVEGDIVIGNRKGVSRSGGSKADATEMRYRRAGEAKTRTGHASRGSSPKNIFLYL